MKIFVSWSGVRSHEVALVWRDFLPTFLPHTEPWVSSEDLSKGERWATELLRQLDTTRVGIVCLVPGNEDSPWLNFEAGALSKAAPDAQVHPFLLTDAVAPKGPLSAFQRTRFDYADVLKMLQSLNRMSDAKISEQKVEQNHKNAWHSFEKQLTAIAARLDAAAQAVAVEKVAPAAVEDPLSGELVELLQYVAEKQRASLDDVAKMLGIKPAKAQYFINKLDEAGFLSISYGAYGAMHRPSDAGLEELVKRGLL